MYMVVTDEKVIIQIMFSFVKRKIGEVAKQNFQCITTGTARLGPIPFPLINCKFCLTKSNKKCTKFSEIKYRQKTLIVFIFCKTENYSIKCFKTF